MKLSEFKNQLENATQLEFVLQNGQKVPSHFHITEIGMITKKFTDCGNTFRISKKATLQLWSSIDFKHRLEPKKVLSIINATYGMFEGEDLEIEIEFQQETVGKFGLEYINNQFLLTNTKTDCLAKDNCGIPTEKTKLKPSELQENTNQCCAPNSNCC
ncbi:DUF6428 family protein [Flavobacterium psychrophilum]|uniref:DUF6428 family protein n=1 Tax=Flavobacterium psychrophilum TaxID=96345 RepID=UPI00106DA410|nr:DUF6428 family protein [Flavobacterium psychrophilum]